MEEKGGEREGTELQEGFIGQKVVKRETVSRVPGLIPCDLW